MTQISLTSAMRSNLLALKDTSGLMDITQNRLSTGLKVNTAIDNPSAYYTASSLNNRANDLSGLLDTMTQAIQTVKAASEGIETATALLEQMSSIAEQALSLPVESGSGSFSPSEDVYRPSQLETKDIAEYEAEGYTVITADMTTSQINNLIKNDAKLVLGADITLTGALNISSKSNVTIDGNGHQISLTTSSAVNLFNVSSSKNIKITNVALNYSSTYQYENNYAAISVNGSDIDVSKVNITTDGNVKHGIMAYNGGKVTLDTAKGIKVNGKGSYVLYDVDSVNKAALANHNSSVYNGEDNTQKILAQVGADALAATAANQFYVGGKSDANFGQGTWYLPAIGELAELYGTDVSQIGTSYGGTAGATGQNKALINAALSTLAGKGVDAATLTNGRYWSSSEVSGSDSWLLAVYNGYRNNNYEYINYGVRCFQLLENCFSSSTLSDGSAGGPQIGDVVYTDLSYGSADDYDASSGKTAAGIVAWVSEDGKSAKIVNLKDLTFSSTDSTGNFNPDDPYGGSYKYTYHTTTARYKENVYELDDFWYYLGNGSITVADAGGSGDGEVDNSVRLSGAGSYAAQYNAVLEQYDMLVNDCSYKGINLLKGDMLSVVFNEDRSSGLNVMGRDISSSSLGLSRAEWQTVADISAAAADLQRVVNSLRSLNAELGNNYSIIQNRQDFTENLINVLTEGADKLTLADMNAESANMLALQTRQQLAVNSLSLSSEAARGVLLLFS